MGANDELSPRMMQLYQLYDQLIQPNLNYYHMRGATPFQPMHTAQRPGMAKSLQGGPAFFSPQFSGSGSRSRETYFHLLRRRSRGKLSRRQRHGWPGGKRCLRVHPRGGGCMMEDIIELPQTQQMRYNGEPIGMNRCSSRRSHG